MMTKQPYSRLVLAALFAAVSVAHPLSAAKPTSKEYRVKAAFLFNFTKFVQWPEDAFEDKKSPLIVGVLGENPFGEHLKKAVADKKVKKRTIQIRMLGSFTREAETDPAKKHPDLSDCHMLFISADERNNYKSILEKTSDSPILTVGETNGFTKSGGIIEFLIDKGKIRFKIARKTAKEHKLGISSKLLKLAKPDKESKE